MAASLRSPEAKRYRQLYKKAAWLRGRLIFLAQHPLCQRCAKQGKTNVARVVNHIRPHKGDWDLFIDPANWEAICKEHHDSDAQSEDLLGYSTETGLNGFPTDPKHPANL